AILVDQPKAAVGSFDHQVADIGAGDAPGGSHRKDRLAVAAVQGEGNAHPLAVVAADLEPVRAPSRIAALDRDPTLVRPFPTARSIPVEQESVRLHDPADPLAFTAVRPVRYADA